MADLNAATETYRITWWPGTVTMPRPLGAWVQDDDGWWRELYSPWRDTWPGGFEEREFRALVRTSEPLGRIATTHDIIRSTPRNKDQANG